ncbi:TniQ family protein [Mycobacterium sp. 852014-52144_SCH5372336]|uniref:TniQ family protein n=1 Tax=Mycobacterium sp. 852014-52144_SCH5372336 TaxID=1834115 RepID=UPI0007FBDB40|nr:TniQ family protein [Mycobacterium sp. 852014-52144_SCH5372336]OBB75921.1 hypothetical protein A5759_06680 [Mycobacterium sp. 852014-52144_SCH5372336]
MNSVRTLPVRVAPADGEALDSWLEMIAHRTNTMHADLLAAVGLKASTGMGTSAWMVQLTTGEAHMLSTAAAVSVNALEKMTLQHYSGRAVRIDPNTRTTSRAFPWGRGTGSRFCPACLDETAGRWQLRWRLGWVFACPIHNCLLADVCPDCGAVQRLRTHIGETVPQPGRCAHPAANSTGRVPDRCGADLTIATVTSLGAAHPAIRTQQVIDAVIDNESSAFGIYQLQRQPRINVLSDIRAIAGRVLAYASPQDLEAVIPPDLLTAYEVAAAHPSRRYGPAQTRAKPGLTAPTRAAVAAVGAVAAIEALGRCDVSSAGDSLRWLVTSSRDRGLAVSATNIAWGKNTTLVLAGAQLAALGPLLKPSDQLRYRIGTSLPNRSTPSPQRADLIARQLPTMLWPAWSLRMALPGSHQRQLRPALAICLLLVNSRLNLDKAARMIGSPIDGQAVSRLLQVLERHDLWEGLRSALIRMADYLAEHEVPIDYRRRRELDYTMLLPDKVWARICRDTGTPGARSVRANIARCLLFEHLSGHPARKSTVFPDSNVFRTQVADFPRYLTPALAQALDEHAHEFLAQQGITDEPSVWEPSSAVLDGLHLPGADPNAVNVSDLHRAVTVTGMKLGSAAQRLSISLDTVRYLLQTHPAPLSCRAASRPVATPYNRAYASAKATISRERLIELYEQRGLSLKDISQTVGVSRQIIGRLALDYGLAVRDPGRRARTTVDRDWLYDQYVNRRRTLPDLAEEAGMSTANMARWAKRHAIPVRGPGGQSHSTARAQEDASTRYS